MCVDLCVVVRWYVHLAVGLCWLPRRASHRAVMFPRSGPLAVTLGCAWVLVCLGVGVCVCVCVCFSVCVCVAVFSVCAVFGAAAVMCLGSLRGGGGASAPPWVAGVVTLGWYTLKRFATSCWHFHRFSYQISFIC